MNYSFLFLFIDFNFSEPIVKVPVDTQNAIIPVLLPDPRDGSLYLLGGVKEPLKKLPFTIPELVATSPCRSSDGILYTGELFRKYLYSFDLIFLSI